MLKLCTSSKIPELDFCWKFLRHFLGLYWPFATILQMPLAPAPPDRLVAGAVVACVCKELKVCVSQLLYEKPVGTLPVSVLLQGKNSGMCLRSAIEIFLITFIVWLWWSWSTRLTGCFYTLYSLNRLICLLVSYLKITGLLSGVTHNYPQHTLSLSQMISHHSANTVVCLLSSYTHTHMHTGIVSCWQLPVATWQFWTCRVMLQSD